MKNNRTASIEKWYRRWATISVGAVLFLILVGGIVRSTGSGMGCPDWPTCFGLLVPPSDVSEIPPSFFEQHPEFETQTFNVFQTWIEYINRLVGALVGFFAFLTAGLSLVYFRRRKLITVLSISALLATGFTGWLGKVVVDKNLEGGFVTLHMLMALIILALLITPLYLAIADKNKEVEADDQGPSEAVISRRLNLLGAGVTGITLIQILLGTQVRENVDRIAISMDMAGRDTWIEQLGGYFTIHKILWIVVALGVIVWLRNLAKSASFQGPVRLAAYGLGLFLGLEILFGVLVSQLGLPPVLQPLHLLFASLIFSCEYILFLQCLKPERFRKPDLNVRGLQADTFAS